ncbi:uncharacterized protein LOC129575653 [Sitodiplosis mosellana]|uniref:uncharacterized protein LOC129575653 n=1 Tax=Sitodiplosis mosellana TaxID=263140 RepID=UPI002444211B|nr:uncharacterized protein LOC129575653 [Sitodiplosis mosellana]
MRSVSILLILTLVLTITICSVAIDDMNMKSLASDPPINTTIVRHKRYLDFIPKSRMFFRTNIKANVLSPTNQLLAFAYGYRANYPIENDIKIKRRDVYDSMEELIDHHGSFNGRACLTKLLCDASSTISADSGMFARLYQLIFRLPQADDELYSTFNADKCGKYSAECPLRLLKLTPYTDL